MDYNYIQICSEEITSYIATGRTDWGWGHQYATIYLTLLTIIMQGVDFRNTGGLFPSLPVVQSSCVVSKTTVERVRLGMMLL